MKRQAGFSLMEVLVATALMVVIMGTTVRALSDATHANEAVTLMADSQENLRAACYDQGPDRRGRATAGRIDSELRYPLNPAPALASAVNRPARLRTGNIPTQLLTVPAIRMDLGRSSGCYAQPERAGRRAAGPRRFRHWPMSTIRSSIRFTTPPLVRTIPVASGGPGLSAEA
jgi:prepilin-type N-terminal cleavage/methylation domain-containing protein